MTEEEKKIWRNVLRIISPLVRGADGAEAIKLSDEQKDFLLKAVENPAIYSELEKCDYFKFIESMAGIHIETTKDNTDKTINFFQDLVKGNIDPKNIKQELKNKVLARLNKPGVKDELGKIEYATDISWLKKIEELISDWKKEPSQELKIK